LIEQILQMPPIAQSVIGSAIFAITLWLIKKVYTFAFSKLSHINKEFNKSRINSELAYCTGMDSGNVEIQSFSLIGLIYIAFVDVIKAIVCLCVGALLANILPIIHEVSIIFALYFLLNTLNVIGRSSNTKNYKERIKELEAQLKTIENPNK